MRAIGVRHRRQGLPVRSYTARRDTDESVYRAPVALSITLRIAASNVVTCFDVSDDAGTVGAMRACHSASAA